MQPRLLRRVDFSEATVLSVYLNKPRCAKSIASCLLVCSPLNNCSHLFQAKSHSSTPPSEMALQYVSYFMFTSILRFLRSCFCFFTGLVDQVQCKTHGFFFSSSGSTMSIHSENFSPVFFWQSSLPIEQAHRTWEWLSRLKLHFEWITTNRFLS